MSRRTLALIAAVGAAAGIGFRIWGLLLPQGALDADEAVVGLLARGIARGTLPVFSRARATVAGCTAPLRPARR